MRALEEASHLRELEAQHRRRLKVLETAKGQSKVAKQRRLANGLCAAAYFKKVPPRARLES